MTTSSENIIPVPPNIFKALRGGFDAIANQVYIIIIPVLLDLWLWLGPHLQVKVLMSEVLESLKSTATSQISETSNVLQIDLSLFQAAIERINLMTFLRSFPVGIPSLVAGILPIQVPSGSPSFIEISSPVMVIFIWLMLTVVGILAGAYYFLLIVQAALNGRVSLKRAAMEWPRMAVQTVALTLAGLMILIILMVPISCILSVVAMGGIPVSQIAVIIFSGMLIWVLFPLIFTPMGIFTFRINILAAVQRSIVLTRMTLPNTVLFIVLLLITSQGFDFLWRVPEENSWLTLIGLAGHGFVASSLLAAVFVYYRDADAWAVKIVQSMRRSDV